jgi:organic hydroperoxide reductase OsmC/OhrA
MPFPHVYAAELQANDESTSWLVAPPRPRVLAGNPPEFDGSAEWWSPEHLLLGSLQVCFRGTFNALAARAGLKPRSWRTRAEATVEKTAAGIVFTQIRLVATVEVAAADAEKTRELLAKAKKHCIVSNQLKTEPVLEPVVRAY